MIELVGIFPPDMAQRQACEKRGGLNGKHRSSF
jgi:hypothetical protein